MPRIIGVDIPGNKRIEYALRYIYGIGPAKAKEIVEKLKLDPAKKADDLTSAEIAELSRLLQEQYVVEGDLRQDQISKITKILQNDMVVEGDLRRSVAADIRRLQQINSYRGIRHRRGLPVRGQRTKTNARTRKGKKITIGAIRDKTQRRLAAKA